MISDVKGENRLKALGYRWPRVTFAHRKKEVTGCWRKLYNEELHNV